MMRYPTILINEGNLTSGILEKERDLIENGAIWHKFFVRNAVQYDRDFVLRTIMDAVDPHDFIPVKYILEGDNVSFFIKNCSKAIHEICSRNLTITNPKSVSFPFKLAILLRVGANVQIDVQGSIMKVLHKRYNTKTKILNLTAFHKDSDLVEFCPLSQPKLLYFVLHLSKAYEYRTLKLCNNDIQNLKSFEAISPIKSLTSIDLRKNKIKSFQELQVLHHWPITDIILEDNPVCNNCLEASYIKEVRHFCPKLQKLDGFTIHPQTNFPCSFRRNFLSDKNGFDLVQQFVEHYFSIYDSPARASLESMYTKSTYFTVTATYLQAWPSFSNAKLGPYINVSHNINKCADVSKTVNSVHIGAKTIANILTQLPSTEHDPYTFTVDLLYYSEKTAVICVTGVFREAADSLLEVDRVVGFVRTFVLMSVGNNVGFSDEFVIMNEMLSVSNATASQEARAFKSNSSEVFNNSRSLYQQHIEIAPARTQNDETQFIDALMKIVGLNSKWANKCLEETSFDLNKALNLFVELHKLDKIPEAAFLSQDEIAKLTTISPAKVTPVCSLSPTPTKSPSPLLPLPLIFMSTSIADDRVNPYNDDPFDTSRPYQEMDRRTVSGRRIGIDAIRELNREKETEQEQERIQERGRDFNHGQELLKDKQIRHSPPSNRSKSPGIKTSFGNTDQFGKKNSRNRSQFEDSAQVIETIDLVAQDDEPKNQLAVKRMPATAKSAQQTMGFITIPAPKAAIQESSIPNPSPQSSQTSSHQPKNREISMSELTEYENHLSKMRGHPNQQQKEIQVIFGKLLSQYPKDVKVWLLIIGTHYKRQTPQKAREVKNRAMKIFSGIPQLGFQIKLAAAQMEMEYVTGPRFSLADKKVGEQNFLQILQQAPNNLNIVKMYVMCLLKRYADNEQVAWDIFNAATSKVKLRLPEGPQHFFDNCKVDAMQGSKSNEITQVISNYKRTI